MISLLTFSTEFHTQTSQYAFVDHRAVPMSYTTADNVAAYIRIHLDGNMQLHK